MQMITQFVFAFGRSNGRIWYITTPTRAIPAIITIIDKTLLGPCVISN